MAKGWSGSPKHTASKSAGINPAPRTVVQSPGNSRVGLKVTANDGSQKGMTAGIKKGK